MLSEMVERIVRESPILLDNRRKHKSALGVPGLRNYL